MRFPRSWAVFAPDIAIVAVSASVLFLAVQAVDITVVRGVVGLPAALIASLAAVSLLTPGDARNGLPVCGTLLIGALTWWVLAGVLLADTSLGLTSLHLAIATAVLVAVAVVINAFAPWKTATLGEFKVDPTTVRAWIVAGGVAVVIGALTAVVAASVGVQAAALPYHSLAFAGGYASQAGPTFVVPGSTLQVPLTVGGSDHRTTIVHAALDGVPVADAVSAPNGAVVVPIALPASLACGLLRLSFTSDVTGPDVVVTTYITSAGCAG